MGLITTLQALLGTPSDDIADYVEPEVSEDILTIGNIVILQSNASVYGVVYGEIVEVDFEAAYPYGVLACANGQWFKRWYSAAELVKVA